MELENNIIGIGSLNETLKIRLGEKKKTGNGNIKFLDHCKIKYNYKEGDNLVDAAEIMKKLLKTNETKLTEFDIKFPSNDISSILRSHYKKLKQGKVIGKGDGKNWYELKNNEWVSVPDPGEKSLANYSGMDAWKCTLWLYVMIPEFNDLGTVACLRTTSYNNWKTLFQQLKTFHKITGGQLTEITFKFKVRKGFTSKGPYAHASIEFPGGVLDLATKAQEVKKQFKELGLEGIQKQMDQDIKTSIDSMQESEEDIFEKDMDEFNNNSNNLTIDNIGEMASPEKELEVKPKLESVILNKVDKSKKEPKLKLMLSSYLEDEYNFNSEQRNSFYKKYGSIKDINLAEKLPEIEKNIKKFKEDNNLYDVDYKSLNDKIIKILFDKKDGNLSTKYHGTVKILGIEEMQKFYNEIK